MCLLYYIQFQLLFNQLSSMGLNARKPVFRGLRTTKAQTSLPSLLSTVVIRLLKIIISRLATSKISIFQLVSVAKETGLGLAVSETPKTGFVTSRPK